MRGSTSESKTVGNWGCDLGVGGENHTGDLYFEKCYVIKYNAVRLTAGKVVW